MGRREALWTAPALHLLQGAHSEPGICRHGDRGRPVREALHPVRGSSRAGCLHRPAGHRGGTGARAAGRDRGTGGLLRPLRRTPSARRSVAGSHPAGCSHGSSAGQQRHDPSTSSAPSGPTAPEPVSRGRRPARRTRACAAPHRSSSSQGGGFDVGGVRGLLRAVRLLRPRSDGGTGLLSVPWARADARSVGAPAAGSGSPPR